MVAYVWQGYARIAEEEFKTQQSGGITTEADPYPNHPQMVRNLPTDGLKNSCHLTGKLRHFLELPYKRTCSIFWIWIVLCRRNNVYPYKTVAYFSPTGFVSIPVIKKRYFRHDSRTPARLPTWRRRHELIFRGCPARKLYFSSHTITIQKPKPIYFLDFMRRFEAEDVLNTNIWRTNLIPEATIIKISLAQLSFENLVHCY